MTLPDNPNDIVRSGYDKIGKRYSEWGNTHRDDSRQRYTQVLIDHASRGMRLLDLGCGNGQPTTKLLSSRYRVTGIDGSPVQIAQATQNVPRGQFICADIATVHFPPESFDAICAFYSIIHVPRTEHASLFQRINRWLRPNGIFVGCLTAADMPADYVDDWLGVPMYWSGFDSTHNRQLLRDAGLTIHSALEETVDEDGDDVTFLWVIAARSR
jgi:SAM-dependent methyltransferase